jgi:hypothetical protein
MNQIMNSRLKDNSLGARGERRLECSQQSPFELAYMSQHPGQVARNILTCFVNC